MAVVVVMLLLRKWFLNPTYGLNWHNKLHHDNNNHSIVMRTYSLEELKKATNDFHDAMGVGATSHVYLAEFEDGTLGAAKRMMEQGRRGSKKVFFDEVSVLLRISHPNIVCLLGLCMEEGEQLLLLEYAPKKSLFHRMHTHHGRSPNTVLSWTSRIRIALDVARATVQGSTMLAEWTMDERTSGDVVVLWKMLDPRLGGRADADQLMILMDIANLALLDDSAARPAMSYVVERLSSCLETPQLHLNSPV
ncbi:Protein STRUBBELIG-RECEPTOR FAMILY 2 [Acorus calamus]|uniref:Protein STRUBBELIG-RECEPTOR FAMILY 2 n=1 Tax=Acorus calamus TaxID=4465 RepID=A0AAV9DV31_ACOCL|nr:Protein STRUBBELIG-RECEPTOR FAMILY 2 [Acorus calamus]